MANEFGVEVPEHTLLSRLGRGGMASVFLARDESLGRLVAVKVIDERFERDEHFQQRFVREARTAAGLTHPNIVAVYRYGNTTDDRPYLSMAYLDGGNLRQRLQLRGALPVHEALAITRQIAGALLVAHARNIVHRDLKPDNVLFQGDAAFLTDFGIAKLLDSKTELTGPGASPGTVKYFSPEQAQEQAVDQRSDIYTLGVMLYEMLTGAIPIAGETLVQLIVRIAQAPPAPLPLELSAMQQFMDVLLAKDPAQRLGSCADVVAIIQAMERNWVRYGEVDRLTDGVSITPSNEITHDTYSTPAVSSSFSSSFSSESASHDAATLLFPDDVTRAANTRLASATAATSATLRSELHESLSTSNSAPRVIIADRTPSLPLADRSANNATVVRRSVLGAYPIAADPNNRASRLWWIGSASAAAALAIASAAYLVPGAPTAPAVVKTRAAITLPVEGLARLPKAVSEGAPTNATSLIVLPEPADAKVRFSIGAVTYVPGMTVAPGVLRVRVEKPGYTARDVAIDVKAGMANAFGVQLVPLPPAREQRTHVRKIPNQLGARSASTLANAASSVDAAAKAVKISAAATTAVGTPTQQIMNGAQERGRFVDQMRKQRFVQDKTKRPAQIARYSPRRVATTE